ncbi:hypothetical protein Tco_1147968, partial [Tanacetum coccineum]
MLQGNNWREFVEENFNQNVALLYFIEEGEDSFYVTGYYGNGCEVIGYEDIDIRNSRPRFMSSVWPFPDTEQGNSINFDVHFTFVPLEAEDDGHGYELKEAFHIDGTSATVVNFRGAINLRIVQRQLSYAET